MTAFYHDIDWIHKSNISVFTDDQVEQMMSEYTQNIKRLEERVRESEYRAANSTTQVGLFDQSADVFHLVEIDWIKLDCKTRLCKV